MTDNLKNLTTADWLLTLQLVVILLWAGASAWSWLTGVVLRAFTGRTVKGRTEIAVNALFKTYDLKAGQTLNITTKDGWRLSVAKADEAKNGD